MKIENYIYSHVVKHVMLYVYSEKIIPLEEIREKLNVILNT